MEPIGHIPPPRRMRHEIATPPLDANCFAVHRARVAEQVELAFIREGVGGLPLVMVHGWPGSKRLWWRNIEPLAQAGFEVIVPDARGFGDSTIPSDRASYADIAASAKDIEALLGHLGHDRCVLVGGDVGSGVVQHLSLSAPQLVLRQVVFNGLSPHLPAQYEAAGIQGSQMQEIAAVSDHLLMHGSRAEELLARLDTPGKRIEYVKGFFTGRRWIEGDQTRHLAGVGNFDQASADFLCAPFEDEQAFRASLGYYEAGIDRRLRSATPRLAEVNQRTPSMILYGIEDEIVGPNYPRRMQVALADHVGPFLVEECGHFVQWERADVLNGAVISFCRDLL